MKRFFYILLAFSILLSACRNHDNDIVIEGDFQGGGNALVRLRLVGVNETVGLDSVHMKNGHFAFTVRATDEESEKRASTPMLYQLQLSENNALKTIAKGGDHLYFTANADKIASFYHVKGSEDAVLCAQLDSALSVFIQKAEEWYVVYQQNMENDEVRAGIDSNYMQAVEAHTAYLKDFVQKHPESLSTFMAFYQSYNRRFFLNTEENFGMLENIVQNLKQKYPENPYVVFMQERINLIKFKKAQEKRHDTH